jgi:hypothetical protein
MTGEPQDYIPLDLSGWCNSPASAIGGDGPAPVGQQTFRGLPFQIGPADGSDPSVLILGGGAGAVAAEGVAAATTAPEIPVGRSARWLIFAHALLESEVYAGGPIGRVVAEYVVQFAGGEAIRIPIRERFEIAITDDRLTQRPFLAMQDLIEGLPARDAGPWGDAGFRQMEASFPWPVTYYLFPWQSPHPDRTIESIRIEPAGQRFVLAAITLGTVDEEPLRPGGPRQLRIELTDPADLGIAGTAAGLTADGTPTPPKPDLTVAVDRGQATFTWPLPTADAATFLADPMRGWGEVQNPGLSPSYVTVAATTSATVTVGLGGEELGRARWSDLVAADGRPIELSPRVRIELIDRGRNWVRTTIVDDETGLPIPCRVHFRSPEGVPYAPHGHHAHVNSNLDSWHQDIGGDVRMGQITYAYTDGTCEGWLPRGDVIVDIASGFEYEPLRTTVRIEPGQQQLQLRLHRWFDANGRRWFSGDTHVHFLSPTGGIVEARGEGLNVVNILQAQWGSLFTNTEDFTGRPQVSPDGRTIVYVSQENREHVMGHLTLLGLRHPVMPWASDGLGEGEMTGTMETTLAEWADRCHEQGGTVIIPHFPSPNGEPAVLVATGRTDAIEMIRFGQYEHLTWYRYLNAGYRLPLVGGTDKMSSDTPVGLYRTYVRIPADEEFTYDSWCRNLRLGRTYQTAGPILHLSVDGREIGDTIDLPAHGGTVEVEAWAESMIPIHTLEIVRSGEVVATTASPTPSGTRRLEVREKLHMDRHGWIAARSGGPGYWNPTHHRDSWSRGIMAHTSPIYVAVGGDWAPFDEATATYMLSLIDGGLEYIRRFSAQDDDARVTHHHRGHDHRAFLERPFHEAIAAIEARRAANARRQG